MKKSELKALIHEVVSAIKEDNVDNRWGGDLDEHDETDMNNPEEKHEVKIARGILKALEGGRTEIVKKLANELLKMHGQK